MERPGAVVSAGGGSTIDLHERAAALDDIYRNRRLELPVTATEAAQRLGISSQLICMWRRAGKVAPIGQEGRSPLYRLGDLMVVERETRNSPHNRKRSVA